MPHFHYRGRNNNGELMEGRMEALTIDAVAQRLHDDAIVPTRIVEFELSNADSGAVKRPLLSRQRLQLPDLIMFTRQMYSLTKSGVPIIRAINGLADTAARFELRHALLKIAEDLNAKKG